jgi:hypothetical protein
MTAATWTAVASRTRHRFCTGGTSPNALAFSCARKRRRRCALPAHSKIATLDSEKAVLQNRSRRRGTADQQLDPLVYELYGLTPEEIKLVEGGQ